MPTTTESILEVAQKLGDLVAQHPAVAAYQQAQKVLADDADASRLMQEFQKVLQQVSHNEQIGMPPTAEQQRALQTLQTQIASHIKFQSYSRAEFELTDLLRKISQTWQKPLAKERAGAGATEAPAGPKIVM